MSRLKVLSENWLNIGEPAAVYSSSERPGYPAINVYNRQRRSKVWRSNGCFEIASGSNTLVIQETIGVNLTATVAAGTYTSSTTFLAALKSALEVVGDSTYTCTTDSTSGKIQISSNGLGGGGVFRIITTHASSTDLATAMGYDTAADHTGSLTHLADILRISTGEWLKWDLGMSSNPEAFILIGHRNEPIKISPSATIKLQGNSTDVWSSPAYESTLPYSENALVLVDGEGLHSEPLRYWRVFIDDTSNPEGYIELSKAYLGSSYQTVRGAPQYPFVTEAIDYSTAVTADNGQIFSDIRSKSQKFSMEWKGLLKDEMESFADIFERLGKATPFFISMDPDAAFSSSGTYFLRYVRFESEPRFQLVSPNNYSMSLSLREEL